MHTEIKELNYISKVLKFFKNIFLWIVMIYWNLEYNFKKSLANNRHLINILKIHKGIKE